MSHPSCDPTFMTRIEFLKTIIASLGFEGAFPGVFLPAAASGEDETDALDSANRLALWERRPLFPLRTGRDSREVVLITALRENLSVEFTYHGGSEPGDGRVVSPMLLFIKPRLGDLEAWLRDGGKGEDEEAVVYGSGEPAGEAAHLDDLSAYLAQHRPAYLLAWCHLRRAPRNFHIGRISRLVIIG
jgi:predicted DNA-binding transcriptional regulator YafY